MLTLIKWDFFKEAKHVNEILFFFPPFCPSVLYTLLNNVDFIVLSTHLRGKKKKKKKVVTTTC